MGARGERKPTQVFRMRSHASCEPPSEVQLTSLLQELMRGPGCLLLSACQALPRDEEWWWEVEAAGLDSA